MSPTIDKTINLMLIYMVMVWSETLRIKFTCWRERRLAENGVGGGVPFRQLRPIGHTERKKRVPGVVVRHAHLRHVPGCQQRGLADRPFLSSSVVDRALIEPNPRGEMTGCILREARARDQRFPLVAKVGAAGRPFLETCPIPSVRATWGAKCDNGGHDRAASVPQRKFDRELVEHPVERRERVVGQGVWSGGSARSSNGGVHRRAPLPDRKRGAGRREGKLPDPGGGGQSTLARAAPRRLTAGSEVGAADAGEGKNSSRQKIRRGGN